MTPIAIASLVLACSFGAGLIGMTLHAKLPSHHLDAGSQDVVKLVMGLVATVAALVLGLLIASASASYDRQNNELKALAANIILLDRTLELYGPDAKPARDGLRNVVNEIHGWIWSPTGVRPEDLNSAATRNASRANAAVLQNLPVRNDTEREVKTEAMQQLQTIVQSRLMLFEQVGSSISWPFLTVLVFWIAMLFVGFGLFARFNATVTVALLVGAISVAGAIFLILEMSDPYHGIMRLSDAPLDNVLAQMDR